MAGTYADVPAHRLAWDRDGTLAYNYDVTTASTTALTAGQMQTINDEGTSEFRIQASGGAREAHLVLYFPAARDIAALLLIYTEAASGNLLAIEWSDDSTDPGNGTWTAFTYAPAASGPTVNPAYRTAIVTESASAITALRIRAIGTDTAGPPFDKFYVQAFHLYGGYTSDLRGWNPSSDVELTAAAFDWGDIAPGSSDTKQLRIKNIGALDANNVVVTREVLTDKTPSVPPQYLLSVGGGTPATSVNLGDLASGAISAVITVHRTTSGSAQSGLAAPRLVAQAGTWT
jgi:hypothetical protein